MNIAKAKRWTQAWPRAARFSCLRAGPARREQFGIEVMKLSRSVRRQASNKLRSSSNFIGHTLTPTPKPTTGLCV